MSHQSFPKIILKRDRVLGSQIIKDNEIRGSHDERRKWFITDSNTSVDGQNNLKREGSGDWEGPLLKEMKSEVYTMIGASDLSPRQTLVAMRDGGTRTTK